jgi:hypothetical protein
VEHEDQAVREGGVRMPWKYNGSDVAAREENRMRVDGYQLEFCCSYCTPQPPKDFEDPCRGSDGWAFRRAIKAWAEKRGIADYRILANTGYVTDLHGRRVYECWTKIAGKRQTLAKEA